MQFLVRLESTINVGCHYGPGDLPAFVWDELITLSVERAYVERLLDRRRDRQHQEEANEQKARSATGLPQPGGTIFPPTRPYVRG